MSFISEISTTQLAKGKNATQDKVFELLEKLQIPYECVENDVVETMEECKELDEVLGTEIRKSLLVRDQKKLRFYLVVMPAEKRCNMAALAQKLGEAKLSFASENSMLELLDCHPGSASVMGTINDTENRVQVVVDKEVAEDEWFGCNPGINTAHLKIHTKDLLDKVLPEMHHKARILSL